MTRLKRSAAVLFSIRITLLILLSAAGFSTAMMAQAGDGHDFAKSATSTEPPRHTIEEEWEYTSLSAEGLDPTRFELLKARIQDGTFKSVDGIVVVKDGKILVEEYFHDHDRHKLHEIRSATKSIGSALMGIAIDQGYVTGAQDKLYSYFQERQPFKNWDERKNDITVEDVLNMTTGLDCDDMDGASAGNESNVLQATDIVRFMLDLPLVHGPGEHWAYCTGSTHLIGAVIESATGMSVQEFAEIHLLEPLNITQSKWNTAGGIAHTGGGFRMRSIDMAKFGQLYLTKGRWHGQKIISEEWINRSGMTPVEVTSDFGYGYLWWKRVFKVDGRPIRSLCAQGNGGNHIFVLPDLGLVVVLAGSAYGEIYGPAQTSMMMSKYILPAVVQDVDPHRGKPDLRAIPKTLFILCAVVLISAFILWPIGFIMRRIRARRVRDSDGRGGRLWPGMARILAGLTALVVLCLIMAFLAEVLPFNLLLNSGFSNPLGNYEVFLGTTFVTVVAAIVWIVVLLAVAQAAFMALAHRRKWWSAWERWHYAMMTLAACYFVVVMLWGGFGKIPS